MTIIDTHVHLFGPPISPHNPHGAARSLDLADLRETLAESSASSAVLVEATRPTIDTAHLLDATAATDQVRGVVGNLQLTEENFADAITQLAGGRAGHLLRGTRYRLIAGTPSWDSGLDGTTAQLAKLGLVLELLVDRSRLRECAAVANGSAARIVVDHLGNPPIGGTAEETKQWRADIERIARFPQVVCKVSGVLTRQPGPYSPAAVRPFLDHALDVFGPQRLTLGSDWPICLKAGSHVKSIHAAHAICDGLSQDEQHWVRHRTAETTYALP